MTAVVDTWSSPTTVWAGGLRQLPAALAGRPMLLVADEALEPQIDATLAAAPSAGVLRLAAAAAAIGAEQLVLDALAEHPSAVPVALGGGSVMDLVRLVALARLDPAAMAALAAADGVSVLPTRAVNPTICLPTTVGTGSEVSPVAVRHRPAGTAMIISPGLRSAGAVLDPALTASLSPRGVSTGLIEPWARICVPAIAGRPLRLQDGLARGLAATVASLGVEGAAGVRDPGHRVAAAQASAQTHLGLLAVGRLPAGHVLWPVATEVMRATGLTKAAALAALLPAWLQCLADDAVGGCWGSADRVHTILGVRPAEAAARLTRWLTALAMPTRLPGLDVDVVTGRVLDPWRSSGMFLAGATDSEISLLVRRAAGG